MCQNKMSDVYVNCRMIQLGIDFVLLPFVESASFKYKKVYLRAKKPR